MDRLINANELIKEINKLDTYYLTSEEDMHMHDSDMVEAGAVRTIIDDAPTVDAEPVRHGTWIRLGGNFRDKDIIYYKCSECGRQEWKQEPYCHCGAKMG